MANRMKYALVISMVGLMALTVRAQSIAHNDVSTNDARPVAPAVAVSGALEHASYSVVLVQNKKNAAFEVTSPKADKAEVKLVTAEGSDVCVIHKGTLRTGKNVFTVPSRKIRKGIYYVISKLSSGEQFADRIVVEK